MPDPFPLTDEQLIEEAEDMLDSAPKELKLHFMQLRLMIAILKHLTKKDPADG